MKLKDNLPQIVVIKIGTSSLTNEIGAIDSEKIDNIAYQINEIMKKNCKVVLVSSGAIKAGMQKLNIKSRPKTVPMLQACAAAGQSSLMEIYNIIFGNYNLNAAQILITSDDFRSRRRFLNCRNTIKVLLDMNCIPIVNENDTVSTDEIKFGENDTLSAIVAAGIDADLLINLSDVNGLYTADPNVDPNAQRIPVVNKITNEIISIAGASASLVGSGGMTSKIKSAKIATNSGVRLVIANANEPNIIVRVVNGEDVGTKFLAKEHNLTSRKRWIAYAAKTKGVIKVNTGAMEKIAKEGKSLLAVGVISAEGYFNSGDIVVINCNGVDFAKGIVYYSSKEINQIAGIKTDKIETILGAKDYDEVVHHDNMVIL